MIVLLDAGPLGLAANPAGNLQSQRCKQWLESLALGGVRVMVPEIADYEVRRELLRRGSTRSVTALDRLESATSGYVTISTAMMRRAAQLWAQARSAGQPTALDLALDGDVILAAQALLLAAQEADRVVIATTNPGHLKRYADAEEWSTIQAPTP